MTRSDTTPTSAPGSRRSIAKASAAALGAAVLVLVTFVVPAEYGIDPLGTGQALGLTRLAETTASTVTPAGVLVPQEEALKRDAIEFTLEQFESVEFKYRLDKGAGMVYAWRATGLVEYDFHTEPEGTASSQSDSFDKGEAAAGRGTYLAPYNGIHGWYWENKAETPVTITLTSSGFYRAATIFRMDGKQELHALPEGDR